MPVVSDWFIVTVNTEEIVFERFFSSFDDISSTPQLDLGAKSLMASLTDLSSIILNVKVEVIFLVR